MQQKISIKCKLFDYIYDDIFKRFLIMRKRNKGGGEIGKEEWMVIELCFLKKRVMFLKRRLI